MKTTYIPTVKELTEAYKISDESAERILIIFKTNKKQTLLDLADDWNLSTNFMEYDSIKELKLTLINILSENFGVEALRDEKFYDSYFGNAIASYVNTGHSYALTLLWNHVNDQLLWASYGDFVEAYEENA
jgi:hypothetical protein